MRARIRAAGLLKGRRKRDTESDAELQAASRVHVSWQDFERATLLEKQSHPWALDKAESTRRSWKYRRAAREVLIVNHDGRG